MGCPSASHSRPTTFASQCPLSRGPFDIDIFYVPPLFPHAWVREGCPSASVLLLVVVSSSSGRQASALSARTRCLHMLHKGGRYRPMLEHMLQPLRSLPDSLTPGTDAPRSHILGPDLCGLAGRHCGRRANADLDPPMARLRMWNSTVSASINGVMSNGSSVFGPSRCAWD